jgi:chromosome segregation ATPase
MYSMWLRATLLAAVASNYERFEESLGRIAMELDKKNEIVPELKAAEKEAGEVVRSAMKVKQLRVELQASEVKLAWKDVMAEEEVGLCVLVGAPAAAHPALPCRT